MAETRVKLSAKQFDTLSDAGKKLAEAANAYRQAQEYNKAISDLVLDQYGLTQDTPGLRVDEATKELVYGTVEETPAPTTPKKQRKAKAEPKE